jgi:hypothetical protein
MDEGELERRLLGKPSGPGAYARPDYGRIHQELRRKVTLTLLWEEYRAEFAERQTYRYTQFCEHSDPSCWREAVCRLRRPHVAAQSIPRNAGPAKPVTFPKSAVTFA